MTNQLLIYVAGPLSAPTEAELVANHDAACAAGKAILDRGHWALIPHLTLAYDTWHEEAHGAPGDYEQYLAWGFALLARCDALLYLAPSPGADRELAEAERLGLPVYRAVEEIPAVRAEAA